MSLPMVTSAMLWHTVADQSMGCFKRDLFLIGPSHYTLERWMPLNWPSYLRSFPSVCQLSIRKTELFYAFQVGKAFRWETRACRTTGRLGEWAGRSHQSPPTAGMRSELPGKLTAFTFTLPPALTGGLAPAEPSVPTSPFLSSPFPGTWNLESQGERESGKCSSWLLLCNVEALKGVTEMPRSQQTVQYPTVHERGTPVTS